MNASTPALFLLVLTSLVAAPAQAAALAIRGDLIEVGPDHVCVVSGSIACAYTPYRDLNGNLCATGVGQPNSIIGVACTRPGGACVWEERIHEDQGYRDVGFLCAQALQTDPNGDLCVVKTYVITDSSAPLYLACIGALA